METQNTNAVTMKELLEQHSFTLPKIGDLVHGTIISTGKSAVLVDLGAIGTGIVYPGEFYDNQTLQKNLKPGQEVSAILLDVEDEELKGYRELSLKRAQKTTAWEDIKEKKESGEVLSTTIVNINKGGLIVELNGVQGFLPLSQLSPEHYPKVEGGDTTKIVQLLQKFRNQEFKVKILDFSEAENKLIVSEKAINEEHIKEALAKFTIGDVVTGTITDVTDFGAFMMITPPGTSPDESTEEPSEEGEAPASHTRKIEGLIHISEIDWKMIENPRDILTPGEEVTAKIIAIEHGKVSLSLKALKEDPWKSVPDQFRVGQTISGKVAKITSYGALVSVSESITGLLPVSEFGGKKPSDVLTIGEERNVTVVSIDSAEHKMLLKLEGSEETAPEAQPASDETASTTEEQ